MELARVEPGSTRPVMSVILFTSVIYLVLVSTK